MPINVHRAPELALRIDLVLVGYAVVWAWLSAAACWPVADEAGAVSGSTAGDSSPEVLPLLLSLWHGLLEKSTIGSIWPLIVALASGRAR